MTLKNNKIIIKNKYNIFILSFISLLILSINKVK